MNQTTSSTQRYSRMCNLYHQSGRSASEPDLQCEHSNSSNSNSPNNRTNINKSTHNHNTNPRMSE